MGIPLIKAFLTALRFTMRPINNVITRKFKSTSRDSMGHNFFVRFGNFANRFEIKLNRRMIGSSGLGEIEDMHTEIAFTKGVDWFSEIFFFYGIIFSIAGYELWKATVASEKQRNLIAGLQ